MSKKKVKVGNLTLGGEHIYIQSMLNIPADDVEGNVRQAIELEKAGCEIIRTAVPAVRNSELIYALKNAVNIPVVADIHFDYRIALECAAAGVDKIRINPGNIGDKDRVKAVADACRNRNIPIRIGVNSGSVERELLAKYGGPTAQALAESASRHVEMLREFDFDDIVLSVKSSDVKLMTESYRLIQVFLRYSLESVVSSDGLKVRFTVAMRDGFVYNGNSCCEGCSVSPCRKGSQHESFDSVRHRRLRPPRHGAGDRRYVKKQGCRGRYARRLRLHQQPD